MPATTFETSVFAAALFVVLSSQYAYTLTDTTVGKAVGVPFAQTGGAPTKTGIAVHAAVLAGLVYLFVTKA